MQLMRRETKNKPKFETKLAIALIFLVLVGASWLVNI